MNRQIEHEGTLWEVVSLGTGVGTATGHVPGADRWLVEFRAVTKLGLPPLNGWIGDRDPSKLSESALLRALIRARDSRESP